MRWIVPSVLLLCTWLVPGPAVAPEPGPLFDAALVVQTPQGGERIYLFDMASDAMFAIEQVAPGEVTLEFPELAVQPASLEIQVVGIDPTSGDAVQLSVDAVPGNRDPIATLRSWELESFGQVHVMLQAGDWTHELLSIDVAADATELFGAEWVRRVKAREPHHPEHGTQGLSIIPRGPPSSTFFAAGGGTGKCKITCQRKGGCKYRRFKASDGTTENLTLPQNNTKSVPKNSSKVWIVGKGMAQSCNMCLLTCSGTCTVEFESDGGNKETVTFKKGEQLIMPPGVEDNFSWSCTSGTCGESGCS